MAKEANIQSSKLARHVLIAMVAGISLGIIVELLEPKVAIDSWIYLTSAFIGTALDIIGQLFILSMKMLVVPLILFSLITGVASTANIATLGRVGAKTIGLYIFTTLIAVSIALTVATLFDIGKGISHAIEAPVSIAPPPTSFMNTLIHFIPDNPIAAMANGNIFQVIVFAVLLGLTLALMGKEGIETKTVL